MLLPHHKQFCGHWSKAFVAKHATSCYLVMQVRLLALTTSISLTARAARDLFVSPENKEAPRWQSTLSVYLCLLLGCPVLAQQRLNTVILRMEVLSFPSLPELLRHCFRCSGVCLIWGLERCYFEKSLMDRTTEESGCSLAGSCAWIKCFGTLLSSIRSPEAQSSQLILWAVFPPACYTPSRLFPSKTKGVTVCGWRPSGFVILWLLDFISCCSIKAVRFQVTWATEKWPLVVSGHRGITEMDMTAWALGKEEEASSSKRDSCCPTLALNCHMGQQTCHCHSFWYFFKGSHKNRMFMNISDFKVLCGSNKMHLEMGYQFVIFGVGLIYRGTH